MDGAFDMMHFGHMNAFRQGRSLGTYLIAGVNSDESITTCKGKPVCNEKERIDTVRGCKWVDEVVENVPYVMNDEYLSYIIEKYNIDYIVHGDDPCIVDGKNVYESAVKLGKYLTIPRTEGVSTTDIVGRMLLMTSSHHVNKDGSDHDKDGESTKKLVRAMNGDDDEASAHFFDRKSNFLTTSRIIRLFGAGVKAPKPTDRVVYIAGAWDMFHAGHIEALEKSKK
jgi:ethanolamine-phosphate cytidylyltransferase